MQTTTTSRTGLSDATAQRLKAFTDAGGEVFRADLTGGVQVTVVARDGRQATRWAITQDGATSYALDAFENGWHDDDANAVITDDDEDQPVPYVVTAKGRDLLTDEPIGYALTEKAHEILNHADAVMREAIINMTDVELRAVLMGLAYHCPDATADHITRTLTVTRTI